MSDTDKTGGPAYPEKNIACPNCWGTGEMNSGGTCQECRGTRCVDSSGMTLLDAFAMAATGGMLANNQTKQAALEHAAAGEGAWQVYDIIATAAYRQAAAMLAEKHRREAGHE